MKKSNNQFQNSKKLNSTNLSLGLGLGLGLNKGKKANLDNVNVFSSNEETKTFTDQNSSRDSFNNDDILAPINIKENLTVVQDDDPFESFMNEISTKADQDAKDMGKNANTLVDIYAEKDELEDYYDSLQERISNNDQIIQESPQIYSDSDEEVYKIAYMTDQHADRENIDTFSNKTIEPLKPIDHSKIIYPEIKKSFYKEHENILSMDSQTVDFVRNKDDISIHGNSYIKPCVSFAHFGLPGKLIDIISKKQFTEPTAIQKQAIPIALSGLDIVGIAKTGSGKTGAFIWPLIVHILGQPKTKAYVGPLGLILAPTRELVIQIYNESKLYCKPFGLRSKA
ncbi:ATP-dependent RNA helicase DDX42 [Smittium culicis]|uniref:ATP-dependent RNA helicase DDX42 n=1 Tax=Smittium culicis TaxID=133412 RepID=A0A1R1Y0S5_9FUNG|nr:ATP-dependent RNA helicase DDX42 [Smittium culicis]